MTEFRSRDSLNLAGVVAVAGSYEGGCYGWDIPCEPECAASPPALGNPTVAWAFQAHIGAVKTVAIDEAGGILATGGVDEQIKLFHLKTRKEKGELSHHKGSVTALQFYKSSHLLSGSQDGTVCIWRTGDWMCLHVLGGHKDAVTAIAVHPSGRMTLSASKDRTLRLWNLVEGRCAYITKPSLPKFAEIERVEWSPDGSTYAISAGGNLQLFNATQTGKPTPFASSSQARRINAIKFVAPGSIAIGGTEDGIYALSPPPIRRDASHLMGGCVLYPILWGEGAHVDAVRTVHYYLSGVSSFR